MPDKIVPSLQRVLRQNIITPAIIETVPNSFESIAGLVQDMVRPATLLRPFVPPARPLLSRVQNLIEMPLFSFKKIRRFNMIAAPLYADRIEDIAQLRGVTKIYRDRLMFATQTVPPEGVFKDPTTGKTFTSTIFTKRVIGADVANTEGYQGDGITACVIDSGARKSHEQLRRVVVDSSMKEKGGSGADANGHGSWCNSCVGGVPATDPFFKVNVEGMAPRCNLVSIQSLGYIVGAGSESDIIEAIEMAVYKYGAEVISMSLGGDPQSEADDPECAIISKVTAEKNVIVVVAAGNSGPGGSTIGSPGTCSNSLTVGAWDAINGTLADFSSRGPTPDGLTKPDVIAPGVNTLSATGAGTLLDILCDLKPQSYSYMSGTSMATPHVAGLVTLGKQLFKANGITLTTDMVKDAMSKYGPNPTKNNEIGWGMITWDVLKRKLAEFGVVA